MTCAPCFGSCLPRLLDKFEIVAFVFQVLLLSLSGRVRVGHFLPRSTSPFFVHELSAFYSKGAERRRFPHRSSPHATFYEGVFRGPGCLFFGPGAGNWDFLSQESYWIVPLPKSRFFGSPFREAPCSSFSKPFPSCFSPLPDVRPYSSLFIRRPPPPEAPELFQVLLFFLATWNLPLVIETPFLV